MTEMKRALLRGVLILGIAVGLNGCASLFDELDRAAVIAEQWRAEEDASRPPVFVPDYSIGAQIAAEAPRQSGCPDGKGGFYPSNGTACPQ